MKDSYKDQESQICTINAFGKAKVEPSKQKQSSPVTISEAPKRKKRKKEKKH